jgi:predicted phosphodiesterase
MSSRKEKFRLINYDKNIPRISGDSLLICSDLHVPKHDQRSIEKMLKTAKELKLSQALINGDFFDNEEISDYGTSSPLPPSLLSQLSVGFDTLNLFAQQFSHTHLLAGNHDDRLTRLLRAADRKKSAAIQQIEGLLISTSDLNLPYHLRYVKILSSLYSSHSPHLSKKVTFHPFGIAKVSPSWVILHQAVYSRNSPDEARRIWERHHCSVITAHTHHTGLRIAPDGKNIWINPGCLTQEKWHRYLFERVRGGPVWNQGYVSMIHGRAKLHTLSCNYYRD